MRTRCGSESLGGAESPASALALSEAAVTC